MTMSVPSLGVRLLCLLLLAPLDVWSHASLVKSVPARRAVLARLPARAQLWFNERLEAQFSQLSAGLSALTPGTYTVKYRVLSVDSHIVDGSFPFTVRGSP